MRGVAEQRGFPYDAGLASRSVVELGVSAYTMSSPLSSPGDALVELRNVTFGYGERVILRDLSLVVPRGKVTALIRDIVLMKLHAVGLRGARDLMPSQISGGMARRVALARAIALDPELIMYDEPFAGLDPISLGTAAQLIRQLSDAMGVTTILVSHNLQETFALADHVVILGAGNVAVQGTPGEVRTSDDPLVRQFVHALPTGPVPFHHPGPSVEQDFGPVGGRRCAGGALRISVLPCAANVPPSAPARGCWAVF